VLKDIPDFCEEGARGTWNPEEMRHLANDGDINKAFDEATHHGLGNEGGYPAHAHDAEHKEENAN
jgi:hypothetical protein